VARFSARADDLGIDLGADTDGPVPASGDSHQLSALLGNLVENALRYTPRGGKVDVSAMWHDGHPCLGVRDTGPGIAPAERERVFDRFYRAAATKPAGGSGLGLAIVKAVAQRHGAEVTLGDAPGGGLAVTVQFPR
jgi:two-component system OmpR family sensor kinase